MTLSYRCHINVKYNMANDIRFKVNPIIVLKSEVQTYKKKLKDRSRLCVRRQTAFLHDMISSSLVQVTSHETVSDFKVTFSQLLKFSNIPLLHFKVFQQGVGQSAGTTDFF